MEMTEQKRKITAGVYLVLDPGMEESTLLQKLESILEEEVAAVQVWDNFQPGQNISALLRKITALCHAKEVPVLINNQWKLLLEAPLDGVHFDEVPDNLAAIRNAVNRPFITGLTCSNDLSLVEWAAENQLDYISFCSVFPSPTSNSCELVSFETIAAARQISPMPVFLAGGIRPDNMEALAGLRYDGVAVISGIMSTDDPRKSIREYISKLKRNRT
jgi:thiamine-phosphate pyrophosphorylase